jgi:hypothetical protein
MSCIDCEYYEVTISMISLSPEMKCSKHKKVIKDMNTEECTDKKVKQ